MLSFKTCLSVYYSAKQVHYHYSHYYCPCFGKEVLYCFQQDCGLFSSFKKNLKIYLKKKFILFLAGFSLGSMNHKPCFLSFFHSMIHTLFERGLIKMSTDP